MMKEFSWCWNVIVGQCNLTGHDIDVCAGDATAVAEAYTRCLSGIIARTFAKVRTARYIMFLVTFLVSSWICCLGRIALNHRLVAS
jgi:hypothetical protein